MGNGLSIPVKIHSSIPQTGTWSWIPGAGPGQPAMRVGGWRRLAGGSLTFSIWKTSSDPCGHAHLTRLSRVGKGNEQLAGPLSFEGTCSLGALLWFLNKVANGILDTQVLFRGFLFLAPPAKCSMLIVLSQEFWIPESPYHPFPDTLWERSNPR